MNSILKSFHLSHKLLMSVLRLRRYDPILNELLMDFSKKNCKLTVRGFVTFTEVFCFLAFFTLKYYKNPLIN